jgi:3-oxoacyl-[acyl-carrier protein] reductase
MEIAVLAQGHEQGEVPETKSAYQMRERWHQTHSGKHRGANRLNDIKILSCRRNKLLARNWSRAHSTFAKTRRMNQIDLKNRVAVVTGGARGIGYAVVERMLRSGAAVSVWDVDSVQLETAAEGLSRIGRMTCLPIDLTDEQQVQKATGQTLGEFGRLDILVNNAGITGGNAPTWELEPSVWRRVIEVNLIAPYLTCRAAIPAMLANGYGRIINVASIAGKEGNPNASHYSASKAGLIGLTKSLGKELATKNIVVNCVTPAAAKTEIFSQMKPEHIEYMLSRIPMNRFGEPKEIAAMVCWLASEECSFATGAVFDISGGRATY